MHSKQFFILFIITVILLQLLGVYFLCMFTSLRGMLYSIPLFFVFCSLIIFAFTKIKITKNSKPVKIWDIFGDVITMTVVLILLSFLAVLLSMVFLHGKTHDIKVWMGVPILSVSIIYGSLAAISRLYQ